jgi:hypothetical protein
MWLRCKEWRCWRFRSRRADGRFQAGALLGHRVGLTITTAVGGWTSRFRSGGVRSVNPGSGSALLENTPTRPGGRPAIRPLVTSRTPAARQARKRNHFAHTSA